MNQINRSHVSNQSGFALVIVLSVILLMSLLATLAFEHLHRERLLIAQLISRDGVFQDAGKRLHECSSKVDETMPIISSSGCCLIEKSNPSPLNNYFRVSVHVIDTNLSMASQSRQQQLIRLQKDPHTNQIKREVLSWREILDPKWDKEIDQSNNNPWELITACEWTRENLRWDSHSLSY